MSEPRDPPADGAEKPRMLVIEARVPFFPNPTAGFRFGAPETDADGERVIPLIPTLTLRKEDGTTETRDV